MTQTITVDPLRPAEKGIDRLRGNFYGAREPSLVTMSWYRSVVFSCARFYGFRIKLVIKNDDTYKG